MATALDVGAYILRETCEPNGSLVTRALQKWTYYAQAWSLAWDGKPLFAEPVEAWKDGPVVRQLYRAHAYKWTVSQIPNGDADALSDAECAVVDAVLDYYGSYTYDQLIEMTHEERPWLEARGTAPAGAHSTAEISQAAMRTFYTRLALTECKTPERRSVEAVEVDLEEVCRETDRQSELWSETLDWLAVR
jgi:uncharacterized phage-associated protein